MSLQAYSLETPRADEMGRRGDILRTDHEPEVLLVLR